MADVDKMIEDIYENLDSSTKKSKTKKDFIPEFKGKVQGAMNKNGIPFTNESFSEAISIIGKAVKENTGMTYDSIDSLVAATFDNLSIKEIARLKEETTKTGADVAKEVAAAAIGVKIAESVANNALSREQLQGLLDHMETLSSEEWGQIYDGLALLPIEDRAKAAQFKKEYYRNNANLTPEEQDRACDNMDLLVSNTVIEDLLKDEEFSADGYSRMIDDLLDELKDFKMARAKVVTLKAKGRSDEEIYRELFEISKTIPKMRAKEYDAKAAGEKNFNELRFIDFGELSTESIMEVMGVSQKEAEAFLQKYEEQRILFREDGEYYSRYNYKKEDEKFFKDYDSYVGDVDLFAAIVNRITRAEIDRGFLISRKYWSCKQSISRFRFRKGYRS